jgi:hypothetical protein
VPGAAGTGVLARVDRRLVDLRRGLRQGNAGGRRLHIPTELAPAVDLLIEKLAAIFERLRDRLSDPAGGSAAKVGSSGGVELRLIRAGH